MDVAAECPITKRKWNLLDAADRQKALAMIRQHRPRLVMLSPPCTPFSILQGLNGGPDPEALRQAEILFQFAVDVACLQVQLGGLYWLEHPATSSAWSLDYLGRRLKTGKVIEANFKMCGHGMTSRDYLGEGLVYKPTRIWTNSWTIAEKGRSRVH